MLLARIIAIACPVLLVVPAFLLFIRPTDFYPLLIISLLLVLAGQILVVKLSRQVKRLQEAFFYFSPGLLVTLGSWLILLMLENFWFKLGLAILTLLALFYYFWSLHRKLYQSSFLGKGDQPVDFRTLEIMIVFLMSTALFGFIDFLNLPKLWLMATMFCLAWLLSKLNEFFQNKAAKSPIFHLLIGLIAVEVFWAIVSLSFVYYIKGIIFSCLYLVFSLFREADYQALDRKIIRNCLVIVSLILFLVLLTARWF